MNVLKRREEDRVPEKHRVHLDLQRTYLHQADLFKVNLSESQLFEVNLSGGHLYEANLSGAFLLRADLSKARGLTPFQLDWMIGNDKTTKLPEGALTPDHWSKSAKEQWKFLRGDE